MNPDGPPYVDTHTRMVIAVVALLGIFISTYFLLYNLGAFGTVVCGTGRCETVQNSPWAYFMGTPMAGLGVAGYLAILVVALLGIQPRFTAECWWPSLCWPSPVPRWPSPST